MSYGGHSSALAVTSRQPTQRGSSVERCGQPLCRDAPRMAPAQPGARRARRARRPDAEGHRAHPSGCRVPEQQALLEGVMIMLAIVGSTIGEWWRRAILAFAK